MTAAVAQSQGVTLATPDEESLGSRLEQLLEKAEDFIADGNRAEARRVLENIVATDVTADDADGLRAKERSVYKLAEIFSLEKQVDALVQLLSSIRLFFYAST